MRERERNREKEKDIESDKLEGALQRVRKKTRDRGRGIERER